MLKSEGYKMFRGSAVIRPKNPQFPAHEVTGDWLYKPEYDCWYVNGHSYPAGIVTDIFDYENECVFVLMEKILALEDMAVTEENAAEIRELVAETKNLLIKLGKNKKVAE